jgi:hypothetical protein
VGCIWVISVLFGFSLEHIVHRVVGEIDTEGAGAHGEDKQDVLMRDLGKMEDIVVRVYLVLMLSRGSVLFVGMNTA